ncbi:MAG: hypothetical protein WC003_02870 [Terrimicrobiaceae bacterium]|jgi:hypothetical protein
MGADGAAPSNRKKKLGEAGWSFSQFDFATRLKRVAGYFFFLATAFLAGAFLAAAFLAGAFLAGAFFTAFFLTGI